MSSVGRPTRPRGPRSSLREHPTPKSRTLVLSTTCVGTTSRRRRASPPGPGPHMGQADYLPMLDRLAQSVVSPIFLPSRLSSWPTTRLYGSWEQRPERAPRCPQSPCRRLPAWFRQARKRIGTKGPERARWLIYALVAHSTESAHSVHAETATPFRWFSPPLGGRASGRREASAHPLNLTSFWCVSG